MGVSKTYPRGSEWRKWDLHVHPPGTKLNDQYQKVNGELDLERFCRTLEESDVAVFAITDYFSFDGYFRTKEKYSTLFPDSNKLLLPGLELRLPLAVNSNNEHINLHLVFPPDICANDAARFLQNLKTEKTVRNNRAIACSELNSTSDFEEATVSIDSIEEAIKNTFGEGANERSERLRHMLIITSAKGDGIRPDGNRGRQRNNVLTDEIDKFSDAFYPANGSREYYLKTDRLEGAEKTYPKPVVDGCDAHSFEDISSGLGKTGTSNTRRNITWIKADPTFEGLLQIIAEPEERVTVQETMPDTKEPYRVISEIRFPGSNVFPDVIRLNGNLNSVIGSRSSGKSALLAYVAHAVSPSETIDSQVSAFGLIDRSKAGPAAGLTWRQVEDSGIVCEVQWKSSKATQGKVIYVPQNSLYSLSEQPDRITEKIAPALFRKYPQLETEFRNTENKFKSANDEINTCVKNWFDLGAMIADKDKEIAEIGDTASINAERDRLDTEIERIAKTATLTPEEVSQYQQITQSLAATEVQLNQVLRDFQLLSAYVSVQDDTAPAVIHGSVHVSLEVTPNSTSVPESTAQKIEDLKSNAKSDLTEEIEQLLITEMSDLQTRRAALEISRATTRSDNLELINKNEANKELETAIAARDKQSSALTRISELNETQQKLYADQTDAISKIREAMQVKNEAQTSFESAVQAVAPQLDDLSVGVEVGVNQVTIDEASNGVNRSRPNDYIASRGDSFDYKKALDIPEDFLSRLADGLIVLNGGADKYRLAKEILTLTPSIRFFATLKGDRIGGFATPSMTPGKQALFALTLILNESDSPWPLLIDQPEDDLDSRSIYETIVPYLVKSKKHRQIIMVSHNANLVVGADSENIIVANRDGNDRKNIGGRVFDYLTGSLESSMPPDYSISTTLERQGVREHAVEILDGGEEAFRKRREKYGIRANVQ